MKKTILNTNYERQSIDVIPEGLRYAVHNDFRKPSGAFNCRYRKYYYWCRGNQKWMYWYTFPYDNKEDMQTQIDQIKAKVNARKLLVENEL